MTAEPKICTIDVLNAEGAKAGSLTLNPEIFGAPVKRRLLELANNAYAANQREGNAATKTRKEVRGGGRKPWRQKGTGRARHGSIRSPIWRGGGTVFGPHPRDYRVDMPKGMRLEALRSALSMRFKQARLTVLEDLNITEPKTKKLVQVLKNLKLTEDNLVCVVDQATPNLKRASQNLEKFRLAECSSVTAYDILKRPRLMISKKALPLLDERFGAKGAGE
jgi:large subunit ribosomal protein L4